MSIKIHPFIMNLMKLLPCYFLSELGMDKRRSYLMTVILVLVLGVQFSFGAVLRTQTFDLTKGWNAIYLDVDPVVRDPEVVFVGSSVDIVASYEGAGFTKQFSTTPGADMVGELGWATWYAPSRGDSFLSELGAVYGHSVYLVHAKSAFSLSVEGTVICTPVIWTAGSYNLVGFSLDALAPPTFAEFFGGSDAHKNSSMYRLDGGVWKKVIDPASTAMRSGEAFWIYADGASNYQGPLEVAVGSVGGYLMFKDGKLENITVRNRTAYPLTPRIEHIVAPGKKMPLSIVVDVISGLWDEIKKVAAELGDASWEVDLPALEAGQGFKIPLAIQPDKLDTAEEHSLLCIKSDLGTEFWVSVSGTREDL